MKLIEAEYSPLNGVSFVSLKHKNKIYTGKATYNIKEEKLPPSAFFGQRIAEYRAMIKYWKEKRDINRIKKQALESLLKDLEPDIQDGVEEDGLYEIILEKLERHIKYYDKETNNCKKQIHYLKTEIKENLKTRKQLLDKVTKT